MKQVYDGLCLIREGNISLPDLVPLLPCLQSSGGTATSGSCSRTSPLQTLFLLQQAVIPPKEFFRSGRRIVVGCQHARSCNAHVDLYLEVRQPHSWSGKGSESSFLFTWEYRLGSLSRTDISTLHKSVTNLLSLVADLTQGRKKVPGVVLSMTGLDSPISKMRPSILRESSGSA